MYLAWARGESWRSIPYPTAHMASYWEGRPAHMRPLETTADWHRYQTWASAFYSTPRALSLAEGTVRFILGRTNVHSGMAYRDDATIFAYELCNEPRAVTGSADDRPATQQAYMRWVERTAVRRAFAPDQYRIRFLGLPTAHEPLHAPHLRHRFRG